MNRGGISQGVGRALTAYVLWGLSPLFWRLGEGSTGSVLVVRVVATFVFLGLIQLVRDRAAGVRAIARNRRILLLMATSAALLAVNWLLFIWSVTNDRVLEASLGYFLNPLVSVMLGVTVLRERLRAPQWLAIMVAAAGVIVLSVDVGRVPWIAITLAVSFAFYGLIRKTAPLGSLDGLTIEISLMFPLAVTALAVLIVVDGGTDVVSEPLEWIWAGGTALITAAPLLLFASAARRIELWMVGVLQYVVPTLQFLLGVFAFDESWSGGQAVGFVVIWSGLAVFAVDGIVGARQVGSDDRSANTLRVRH